MPENGNIPCTFIVNGKRGHAGFLDQLSDGRFLILENRNVFFFHGTILDP